MLIGRSPGRIRSAHALCRRRPRVRVRRMKLRDAFSLSRASGRREAARASLIARWSRKRSRTTSMRTALSGAPLGSRNRARKERRDSSGPPGRPNWEPMRYTRPSNRARASTSCVFRLPRSRRNGNRLDPPLPCALPDAGHDAEALRRRGIVDRRPVRLVPGLGVADGAAEAKERRRRAARTEEEAGRFRVRLEDAHGSRVRPAGRPPAPRPPGTRGRSGPPSWRRSRRPASAPPPCAAGRRRSP